MLNPANLADFSAFVKAVADRYGKLLAGIEVYNEPNSAKYWGAPADPECDAMRAGSIRNVADDFSGGSIHYHRVRSPRNEHSASAGLGSQVVSATITTDVVLLNLEGLCVANIRCNDGSDQQSRNRN